MSSLYLIRHGSTEWNKAKRYMGMTDIELCYEGMLQANCLSNFFKNNGKIDYIVSSPLKRALETSIVIANSKKLPIEINDNLTEANFGNWEGLTFKEIKETYPEEASKWYQNPSITRIPGAENFDMFKERVRKTFHELEEKAKERDIIAVTHGGPIRYYLSSYLGIEKPSEYLNMELPQGSVSHIDCSNSSPKLNYYASVGHLVGA